MMIPIYGWLPASDLRAEPRRSAWGFSLIEVLVVIAVVAVLIAIVTPSLRGARLQAESSVCLRRLGQIGQGFAVWSEQQQDAWPNLYRAVSLSEPTAFFTAGQITYSSNYFMQPRFWAGTMIGTLWSPGDPSDALTCPYILRTGFGLADGRDQLRVQPLDGAIMSYYYSATLISAVGLWNPDDPAAREAPDRFRRRVGVHEVQFPSEKGVLAEVADYHGRLIARADEPQAEFLNILFADGRAQRTRTADLVPGLPVAGMFDISTDKRSLPILSTPRGVQGRDIARGKP